MEQRSPRNVAVLMDGHPERGSSSRASGAEICQALRRCGYQVTPLAADTPLPNKLAGINAEVVFLALRGRHGSDGSAQGLLEVLGLPYTGSGVLAAALACDRLRAKDLLHYHNIPTPPAYSITSAQARDPEEVTARQRCFPLPVMVKPRYAQHDLGAVEVRARAQLDLALAGVTADGGDALVERSVAGRDIVVGVLEGRVLGAVEVHAAGDPPEDCAPPADLSRVRLTNLAHLARAAYLALGCRGAAVVKFVCADQENDSVLAVDPSPLLCAAAPLARAARQVGLELDALCAAMVEGALCAAMPARPRVTAPAPSAAPATRELMAHAV